MKMIKHQLVPAKDWIIENQNKSGSIYWDHRGKCDPWDHCECLIALAIYEEWDAFNKGIEWFFNNLNAEGEIASEFINGKVSKGYTESHHAPYVFLPLYQKFLIDNDIDYLVKYKKEIQSIYNSTLAFADSKGFLFWAKDEDGYSDNSLITASCSVHISLKTYEKIAVTLGLDCNHEKILLNQEKINSKKFDRDGVSRKRFSMDNYYPFLCGIGDDELISKTLSNFYNEGLGIKCVIEEPWVTFAESSEFIISLVKMNRKEDARKILEEIMRFQDNRGIFPTGYQYKLDILWPDEFSTWTNAAVIIAADCVFEISKKRNVFLA